MFVPKKFAIKTFVSKLVARNWMGNFLHVKNLGDVALQKDFHPSYKIVCDMSVYRFIGVWKY